ncbi:unnamed protein product [Eruca vesicaria subsp. sativa]|uniref:Uncharacterized protein n=1 Tax=Eruca vesicaria subsp. sativa TaxID=29727 RepID=A0ABC8M2R4_ERUVS|nr:unnamed protein product [Eruca vesicaria subsp. sativa]
MCNVLFVFIVTYASIINQLNVVYKGYTSEKSVYVGMQAVLVLAIVLIKGRWVALVKLSHGINAGARGYMYISLSKMILNVKYSACANLISQTKDETDDEATTELSYLLRNFTGVNYGDSRKSDV